jgi:hypothetical protein
MRALVWNTTLVLAVAYCSAAAVSCGDDGGGNPDGGGKLDGSGGTGGSGGAMDAGDEKPGTVGCIPPEEVPVACPTPPVTFANVESTFQARCVSACHNGVTPDPNIPGGTLWPLVEREHILQWEDAVRAFMADCSMPPPDAGIPMTIEERKAIIEFLRCEGRHRAGTAW